MKVSYKAAKLDLNKIANVLTADDFSVAVGALLFIKPSDALGRHTIKCTVKRIKKALKTGTMEGCIKSLYKECDAVTFCTIIQGACATAELRDVKLDANRILPTWLQNTSIAESNVDKVLNGRNERMDAYITKGVKKLTKKEKKRNAKNLFANIQQLLSR